MRVMRKLPVVPFCRRPSGLPKWPNQRHHPRRPASARGTFRPIVTKREAGCDGRKTSFDVAMSLRTSKACGPGTPGLVLSAQGDDLRATVTIRSRTPGRARTTPLKPLRREGRVAPVEPVVTNSCAFYTAHEAAGATSIRSSLRPPLSRDTLLAKLGRNAPREREGMSPIRDRHSVTRLLARARNP
jgi:hypothetical protein